MKARVWTLAATALVITATSGYGAYCEYCRERQEFVLGELGAPPHATYAAQKVVYHITGDGGWFGRDYRKILGSVQNHLDAMSDSPIDLRVMLQGDGVGLLRRASGDAGLAQTVDRLRRKGVRFEVCRNSLLSQGVAPSELYGLGKGDVVPAAVAELAALQAQGFVYLRP